MKARLSPVDARWLEVVIADTDTLLNDHAHCERKAAGTALSLVARHPGRPPLVEAMLAIAQEELAHFAEVHGVIRRRGRTLGPDEGDPYAKALVTRSKEGSKDHLTDRLLVASLIEARSCSRLMLLGRHHPDPELAGLFDRFGRAEAGHAHTFVQLARELSEARAAVDDRLAELSAFEMRLVDEGPVRCAMH